MIAATQPQSRGHRHERDTVRIFIVMIAHRQPACGDLTDLVFSIGLEPNRQVGSQVFRPSIALGSPIVALPLAWCEHGPMTASVPIALRWLHGIIPLACAGLLAAQTSTTVVSNTIDTSLGTRGHLQAFMSTSFSFSDNSFFQMSSSPDAAVQLSKLAPQHMRISMGANTVQTSSASQWDFTVFNEVMPKLLSVGDQSPLLAIQSGPLWMDDKNGHLLTSHISDYAQYCANLVSYMNKGGFVDASGVRHQAPTGISRITLWSIYNEPDLSLASQDYISLYNATVSAMKAVDPSIKIVAGELASISPGYSYVSDFINGVKQPADAFAYHFYSLGCQPMNDTAVMGTIATAVDNLTGSNGLFALLRQNIPVWMTENNLSFAYDTGGGTNSCNNTAPFPDPRAGTPFFAAYRSYLFSKIAKSGAQSLHHWDYDADVQFGEVSVHGAPYLAYWVDYYLSNYLRGSVPGPTILKTSGLNPNVEELAVQNADGSVVVMLANHGVAASGTTGLPVTVTLDISSLGTFTSASEVLIDAMTNIATGPVPQPVVPPQIAVAFRGYGTAFVVFSNPPTNPSPTLSSISPANATAGGPSFTLTVTGANFISGSSVQWNGSARTTTYISSTQLQAIITSDDLANAGTAKVTVANAAPGGGISASATFTIVAPVAINFGGILNAASFSAPPLSAGSIVSLFGNNLAPEAVETLGVPLPNQVGAVSVLVNGKSAPLFYVSPQQINFQMPWEITGSVASVVVQNGSFTSSPATVSLSLVGPGIFTVVPGGPMQGAANRGSFVSIYCTGLGPVQNTPADGTPSPGAPNLATTQGAASVLIGGISVTPTFAGLAPNYVGLYQVNAQVPLNLTLGNISLSVIANGVTSNAVTLAVQ